MKIKNIEDIYPLTPMQQGILFHTLYAPESGVYFEQLSCTFQGKQNPETLRLAWQEVLNRHPALRTAFLWEGLDEALQIVRQQVQLPWIEFDWRDQTSEEQQANLAALLGQERTRGFDLTQAPLMRIHFIRLGEDTYQFIWGFHHLLLDGWCMPIVLKDLFIWYDALLIGEKPHLPQPKPFRNYIAWLQQQDHTDAKLFWQTTLAGFTAPTPLPLNRIALPMDNVFYQVKHCTLSTEVTAQLQAFAQASRVTLNTLVQGAWALLLSRYSGEEDILFGATVSGRPPDLEGVESMVGLFINTLPVRVQVDETATLLAWLQQLQAQQVAGNEFAYSPLVEIQGWSDMPRGISLFESLVIFENYPVNSALQEGDGELQVTNVRFDEQTNYPLTLLILPDAELTLHLNYDTGRFDAATIDQMTNHLQTLLSAMPTAAQHPLRDIPMLSLDEETQLLDSWNETAAPYPNDVCLHTLFEAQARATPDAIAVEYDGETLTYRALEARANQLAHHLLTMGVKPDTLVGIYIERSLEMMVGLLGILKAGAAYVPLDPSFPQERLAFMVQDADISILVTQKHLDLSGFQNHLTLLYLDDHWTTIDRQPGRPPMPTLGTPNSRAYVIYTSGSTGLPKGVEISHGSVVNFLHTMGQKPGLTEHDTLLAVTTLSFDIAVLELFLPLIVGAKVVIASKEVAADGLRLAAQLKEATVMQATPATWRLLLAAGWAGAPNLVILCGGEALPWELAHRLQGKGKALWNMYGPTETTIWSTIHPITAETPALATQDAPLPIGRPIANTKLYILDRYLHLQPVGVPGELHIGGDGLALGYLNRPELTNEKFIPNPFCRDSLDERGDGRLYKTGDLARYRPDGTVEYIGRADFMVKIRGYRVELGEIEAILLQHSRINDAVVTAQADGSGEQRLVAYMITGTEEAVNPGELRHFLGDKLPAYMIPSAFVTLEAFPLTPNGKVNRPALPRPGRTHLDGETRFVAPRTPNEEMLASIWADVLTVEQVGVHDNFFDLGGHSLLATQVVSRVRETLSLDLTLRDLFAAPTIAQLGDYIETGDPQRQDLILPPIEVGDRSGPLPLSFAQQRLWFMDQLGGESAFYLMPMALNLQGVLDVDALERALLEIIRRHEILRSRIVIQEAHVYQVIDPDPAFAITHHDWQNLPSDEQKSQMDRHIQTESQQPFDLEKGSLLRCSLMKLAPEEHVLQLTMHHIVSDAWSLGVFVTEFSALYGAFVAGEQSPLAELPIQYVDFAQWQRTWLSGEILEAQLAHWEGALAGAPPLLELPTDRPRPAIQKFEGRAAAFTLDMALTNQLNALSQSSDVTLFMLLLSAYGVLLHRYSGQDDIVIGSPIANRNRREIETLMGLFINTLVFRLSIEENPSFATLLNQVRQTALDAYAHQDLPFEQLVEALQPERNLSHTPLFQVAFIMQNAPMGDLTLPGLTFSVVDIEEMTAKFDLTLSMIETEEGLLCSFKYNSHLFDEATVQRMIAHFKILLKGIVASPQTEVGQLPLLSEEGRDQLLYGWNHTGRAYPQERCIHQVFEAQVASTPDALALICQDQQLTYAQLNSRANQLAHLLQQIGVGPEVMVGVCIERSVEMVVALYAILKAGGAYVPLDPTYPPERLAFMLEDAQVPVLLTSSDLLNVLPEQGASVLCLDDPELVQGQPETNPQVDVQLHNLAYTIYTSGSTGKPKGAMNTHSGILNRLLWMQEMYSLDETDRVLQKTPFSFDVSVWEFFWPLMTGAKLVVLPPEKHKESAYLVQTIVDQAITTLHFVPSMLQLFIEDSAVGSCTSLRRVICSGEALPFDLQERFFQRLDTELHNLYGPTEAAIDVSYWECLRENDLAIVPIGRPIANTQLYILDKFMQPVPLGVSGELFIGGQGVARGYHNRPALTQERFISDPFRPQQGFQLYRTGDLVRYRAAENGETGIIEFLGRMDHQVKIRGFRIELGEIETMLATHAAVRECVIVAMGEGSGEKRLVAYLVPSEETNPTTTELRAYLAKELPEYMIPSAFVMLDALPLSPNGKVDRRRLPAPTSERPQLNRPYQPPQTALEIHLAETWQAMLGLDQVGVHDNFFELGGNSIRGALLINKLQEQIGEVVRIVALFDAPTISQMSAHLETLYPDSVARLLDRDGDNERVTNHLLSLVPAKRKFVENQNGDQDAALLPLSFAQQRLWILSQLLGRSPLYNMPIALHLTGQFDMAALHYALAEIVKRHEVLRTKIEAVDGTPMQIIAPTATIPVQVIDLQNLPPEERESRALALLEEEAQTPFDLHMCPLLRVLFIQLAPTEQMLIVNMHHIISDGWSLNIFLSEFSTFYTQSTIGHAETALPELPIQYGDYAVWQRHWLRDEMLETYIEYWRTQLAEAPPLLELPTDYPRPPVQRNRGGNESFALDNELVDRLNLLSQQVGTTLFMTFSAAFGVLLSRLSHSEDVVIGSPIAGRNRQELEPLIGFFVNSLALRLDFHDAPSFTELLHQVRQTALDAFAHQELPFEQLVEVLAPERSLSHHPIFQVMFATQDRPAEFTDLDELTVSMVESQNVTAKFDLSLAVIEIDDGYRGHFEYDRDLFKPTTIRRWADHFQTLLHMLVADPSRSVAEVDFLSTTERAQLLYGWNQQQDHMPEQRLVHQLIESQAQSTPDAVALVFQGEKLTYRELDERANGLAHYLRSQGVGPEIIAGISIHRSPEMIVAMLGIFKAGGAYLPLDPDYPQERLTFMMKDASVQIVLTTREVAPQLPPSDIALICLDEDISAWQATPSCPPMEITSANLAYVIYTSGSTGTPKGVLVPHRGLANVALEHIQFLDMGPDSRAFQFVSLNFDAATADIFTALCAGATLYLADKETSLPGPALRRLIESEAMTHVVLPGAVLSVLDFDNLPALQTILTGGEACTADLVAKCLGPEQSNRTFFNVYGPTETTIATTAANCLVEDPLPPIGRPFAHTQVYLLDQQFQPVPIGVPGRLYIGGIGMGRGYLNQPGLTASRFLPDPFSTEPGARLYDTGDVARYRSDGNLTFVGRADNQVKLRGFRIEIGEVESALMTHTALQNCAVILHEDSPNHQYLVAYVVSQNPSLVTAKDIYLYLGERLPSYMIPAAYVFLDSLPLMPNGKVDRRVLPTPEATHFVKEFVEFVAPRTETEEIIVAMWADLLNRKGIGIYHNFFELGGHSLLATQVISRIVEQFNVELPLRTLFEEPTIANLASAVDIEINNIGQRSARPAIIRRAADATPLASFAQQRLWFLDQLQGDKDYFVMGMTLRLSGPLQVEPLANALGEIVRRHEILRTTFDIQNNQVIQIIAPDADITLRQVDVPDGSLAAKEKTARDLVQAESNRPFDLATGPLLRTTLCQLGPMDHVLHVVMHHIVSDGWSMSVLMGELAALYDAYEQGQPSPLPELPIQYGDFALWQRGWLEGEVLADQLRYWKEQLTGAATLQLPKDRPRPAQPSLVGGVHQILLSQTTTDALNRLSQEEGCTLFMTTLAAFKAVLHRTTSQEDIVIGTDVANRNGRAIEELIGFFINQLVLRTDLSGNPTFRELMARVRQATTDGYTYQDIPFDMLVKELQPLPTESQMPLFQAKMVFQNMPMPTLDEGDLSLTLWESDKHMARYDLLLRIAENAAGLSCEMVYSTDLFDRETITRLMNNYETLLQHVIADSDTRLNMLNIVSEYERREREMELKQREKSSRTKLRRTKRKRVNTAQETLVKAEPLFEDSRLPLLIQPAVNDLNLLEWAQNHRSFIDEKLVQHGGILFRGFDLDSVGSFEPFALTVCSDIFKENGEHMPVSNNGNVQTPVFFSPAKKLLWHNENSFNYRWPLKIIFCCTQPAAKGGATPIVDSRRIFERIDPKIRQRFLERGVMYVRNYGGGLGMDWQTVLRAADRAAAEAHCRENRMNFSWKSDDRLRTEAIRPAVIPHPETGEMTWFNQAQHWHIACLDPDVRETLITSYGEEDLPRACYYGDGSPIEDSIMDDIMGIYNETEVSTPWQKGDVMMLDNVLTAHAREPYEGERKLLVAMGEMHTYDAKFRPVTEK